MMPGRRWSDGLHQAVEAKERRPDQGGEPDPRDDHAPELLPALQEARRHDRHRHDRGRRVLRRSTSSTSSDPDQPPDDPRRPSPTSSTRPSARSATPSSRRSTSCRRQGRPGPRRHPLHREVRAALGACSPGSGIEHQVLNAKHHEREAQIVAQAGRNGRGHDRHQHGRPRHRHQARRQPAGPGVERKTSAACTSSAPSATRRGASTTSCAAAAGRQGDPGSSRFYLVARRRLMRLFARPARPIMEQLGMKEGEDIETGMVRAHRERPDRRSRATTSTSASSSSSTTT